MGSRVRFADRLRAWLRDDGTPARFFRYCVGGALSFGTNLGLTWALHERAGVSAELAFAVALATVFVLAFFVFRHFIYRSSEGRAGSQLVRYAAAAAGFRGAEYLGFLVLHTLAGTAYLLAAAAVLVVSFVAKFLVYGARVFVAPGAGDGGRTAG